MIIIIIIIIIAVIKTITMNNHKIPIRIVIIRIDAKHVFYFGDKKHVKILALCLGL